MGNITSLKLFALAYNTSSTGTKYSSSPTIELQYLVGIVMKSVGKNKTKIIAHQLWMGKLILEEKEGL